MSHRNRYRARIYKRFPILGTHKYGVSEPAEFADLDDAAIEELIGALKMAKRKKFSRAVDALSTENA